MITTTNYNKPNFGMAIKATPEAKRLLEQRLTLKDAKKLNKIIEAEKNNPVDVKIRTTFHTPSMLTTGISASVEDKATFKSYNYSFLSLFGSESRNFIRTIKKAVKSADEHQEIKSALKNLDTIS